MTQERTPGGAEENLDASLGIVRSSGLISGRTRQLATRAAHLGGDILANSAERLGKPTEVEIIDKLVDSGIRNFFWFHCSITDTMQQVVVDKAKRRELNYFDAVSEHSLTSMAFGAWLATGEASVVVFQNSGIGNALDGLITAYTHKAPMLIMPTHRGWDETDNSEPHQEIGDMTKDLTRTMFKNHSYGERDGRGFSQKLGQAIDVVKDGGVAGVVLAPKAFNKTVKLEVPEHIREMTSSKYWETRKEKREQYKKNARDKGQASNPIKFELEEDKLPTRSDAIGAIIEHHEKEQQTKPNPKPVVYLICNGYNARTAYWQHDRVNMLPNVAGMGGGAAIGYGAAWTNPDVDWVVIDGDQNYNHGSMHPLLADPKRYPPNLYWYILDNEIGASVGTAESVSLPTWAEDVARIIPTKADEPGEFNDPRVPNPPELARRLQHWVLQESKKYRARQTALERTTTAVEIPRDTQVGLAGPPQIQV